MQESKLSFDIFELSLNYCVALTLGYNTKLYVHSINLILNADIRFSQIRHVRRYAYCIVLQIDVGLAPNWSTTRVRSFKMEELFALLRSVSWVSGVITVFLPVSYFRCESLKIRQINISFTGFTHVGCRTSEAARHRTQL